MTATVPASWFGMLIHHFGRVWCMSDGKMTFEDESTDIGDSLRVEFEKGSFDNPKVCAFLLVKGKKEGTAVNVLGVA